MTRPQSIVLLLGVGALASACTTLYPPSPTSPGAAGAAASVSSLADEQSRLRQALGGTPVTVELTTEGRLRIEVPLKHSFDPGRSAVKPALAAVLDRMTPGLRQLARTQVRIAAPPDPNGSAFLGADRAASTRDYLVIRGIGAARFVTVARGAADSVEIVVSERK